MWSRSPDGFGGAGLTAILALGWGALLLPAANRYQASEPHMGTVASITLYAESPDEAQQAFVAAFARIAELDAILSDYKPDSELSRICESNRPLSPDLRRVLAHAQRLARKTDGAFDITAGPVIRLWREARSQKRLPDPEKLAEALSRSGYRKLTTSGECLVPGMQLDAGGIAKGYAADEALAVLRQRGIGSALVALSGDIVAGDAPPRKDGWRVQVQDRVLTLSNSAVSTSGDEFQFTEIDGVRYSHIVDPRTGMPLRNSKPVSVIADQGMDADSLATACSVDASRVGQVCNLLGGLQPPPSGIGP